MASASASYSTDGRNAMSTPSMHSRTLPTHFATPSATPGRNKAAAHVVLAEHLVGCQSVLTRFEEWASTKKMIMEDEKAEYLKRCNNLQENEAQIKKQIGDYRAKETEYHTVFEKQRAEAATLEAEVGVLKEQKEEKERAREDLQAQLRTLIAELNRRKDDLRRKREQVQAQRIRDLPELELFKEKLALEIVSISENFLQFTFTHVNENRWDEQYTFTLDVTVKDYQVTACSPMLPELDSLVKWLNDSRDFYSFLKWVRKAFHEYAVTQRR